MNTRQDCRLRRCLSYACAAIVLVCSCPVAPGGELEDRFRQEYPAQRAEWKRIEAGLPKSDISTISEERGGRLTPTSRLTIKERHGSYLRVMEFLAPPSLPTGVKLELGPGATVEQVDFAYGRNSRYSFELSKQRSGWLLRRANVNAPSRAESIEAISKVSMRKMLFPEYELPARYKQTYLVFRYSDGYDDLLSTRDFRLLGISQSEHDGLVRVDYRNTFRDDTSQKDYPATGWVIFDPNRYWVPAEFSFTFGDDRRRVTRSRKDTLVPGTRYPLVKSTEMKEVIAGTTNETNQSRVDHEVRFGDDVEEGEFTLTAFGLPEPVGVTWERPTPRYVWFLAAAGACAAVAVLFRWLARRRTRSAAA